MGSARAVPPIVVVCTLACSGAGAGACSSSSSSGGGAAPDASTDTLDESSVTCAADPRAEAYTANMTKAGKGGAFTFVLVSGDPAPPSKGTNRWTVRVTGSGGGAVAGGHLDVKPFMPDHGHGTSVVPTITAHGDGSFDVSGLYLFMPGLWQVTLTASDGATTDAAVFSFCVAG